MLFGWLPDDGEGWEGVDEVIVCETIAACVAVAVPVVVDAALVDWLGFAVGFSGLTGFTGLRGLLGGRFVIGVAGAGFAVQVFEVVTQFVGTG